MSDRFNEIGFTLQEEDACWAALKAMGLAPRVHEDKTRFEIVTTVVDLHDAAQAAGSPGHEAIRPAVWKLLALFERDTRSHPIVSADSSAEDGLTGNACAFLIACLSPANLVEREALGSNILAAYRAWIDERRHAPHPRG
jgi:hypothetical protein